MSCHDRYRIPGGNVSFLEIALANAARGWHVFPLKPRDKYPLIKGGGGFYGATLDAEQITAWWTQCPDANVGIACGASGLYVVDCDHGLADEAAFYAWRERNGLPVTYTVRTGRRTEYAVQMYYRGAVAYNGKWVLDGCSGEIRSIGGLVCAVGSVHPVSGETYQLLVDAPLAERPAIMDQSVTRAKTEAPKPGESLPMLGQGDGRHPLMMKKLGQLHHAGLSEEEAIGALAALSDTRFSDPISLDEIERTVRSCYGKWAAPEAEPKVVIGKTVTPPEAAPLPERKRPVYPVEGFEGTAALEFARLCADDNHVPLKMYIEAFRTILGAVVGDRIHCRLDGALMRLYTFLVSPFGKGKGTACGRARDFFRHTWASSFTSVTPELLSSRQDFLWKPQGIGARDCYASSVPGMIKLIQDPIEY